MRRRGRLLARVGLSFALLALLVAVGPRLLPPEWLAARLAGAIAPHLAAPIEIGRARVGWIRGLVLEDVRVGPPPGFRADVLQVPRLEVRYLPWALLGGRLEVSRLEVRAPRVVMEADASGLWNVQRVVPPSPAATSTSGPFRTPIPTIVRSVVVSDLRVEVARPGSRLGSGPVDVRGAAQLEGTRAAGTVTVDARPAERGVLDERPFALDGRGTFTATAAYDFGQPWTRAELVAEWRHDLVLEWPAIGSPLSTEAVVRARLDPEADRAELHVEALRAGPTSRLEARATLEPASAWSSASQGRGPTLELEVDGLADLADTLGRVDGVARSAGTLRFEDARVTWTDFPRVFVPRSGRGRARADGVALAYGDVELSLRQARLEATTEGAATTAALQLRRLDLRRASTALSGLDVDALATVQGRATPIGGTLTATASADSARASGWQATQPRVALGAAIAGASFAARPERAELTLEADARRLAGGDVAAEDVGLRLASGLGGAPGATSASVEVDLGVGRLAAADRRARALRLQAALRARGDRLVGGTARVAIEALEGPDLSLSQAEVDLAASASAPGSGADHRLGPLAAPNHVAARVVGSARRAGLPLADGSVESSVELRAEGDVDVRRRRISELAASLTSGLGAEVRVEGELASTGPWQLAGSARVGDVGGALDALPVGVAPTGLSAEGAARLEGRVSVPRGSNGPDFGRATGAARLALADLSVALDEVGGRRMTGELRAVRSGRRLGELGWTLRADRIDLPGDDDAVVSLVTTGTASLTRAGARLVADATTGPGQSRLAALDLSRGVGQLDVWHPRGGGLEIRRGALRFPELGLDAQLQGDLRTGPFGAWQPNLVVSATVSAARLSQLIPGIRSGQGQGAASVVISTRRPDRLDVAGAATVDDLTVEGSGWRVDGARGRFPFAQRLALPRPRFSSAVAGARGALDDDLEARARELLDRLSSARLVLGGRDIRVDSPVTADYQALRPYSEPPAPDAVAERLILGGTELSDVVFEADWDAGLLSVRRLAFSVWQGDVQLDAAAQVSPDGDVRARTRGTATHVNLDIPYARVEGREPRVDAGGDGPFRTSAVLDLRFGLRDRQLDGTIDLQRVTKRLLERAFGALELESARSALKWLELSERFGVRPTKGKVWISNNLLSAEFDWERLWIHVAYRSAAPWDIIVDTFFIAGRLATVPTVGASIINIVNSAVRRFSIGNLIDRGVSESGVLELLKRLDPYVVGADEE